MDGLTINEMMILYKFICNIWLILILSYLST